MQPDELALRADLESARFLAGQDRNRWQFRDVQWPFLFVDVNARDGRAFTLRLDCRGYPANAPTGTFWDFAKNMQLAFEKWPVGSQRIPLAFNQGWKGGTALYIPCDRESFIGHDGWISQYPQMIWNRTRGITLYLEVVFDLLQSRDYACTPA